MQRPLPLLCKPVINYHYYIVTQKQCLHKASALLSCTAFCQSCLNVESFTELRSTWNITLSSLAIPLFFVLLAFFSSVSGNDFFALFPLFHSLLKQSLYSFIRTVFIILYFLPYKQLFLFCFFYSF